MIIHVAVENRVTRSNVNFSSQPPLACSYVFISNVSQKQLEKRTFYGTSGTKTPAAATYSLILNRINSTE